MGWGGGATSSRAVNRGSTRVLGGNSIFTLLAVFEFGKHLQTGMCLIIVIGGQVATIFVAHWTTSSSTYVVVKCPLLF